MTIVATLLAALFAYLIYLVVVLGAATNLCLSAGYPRATSDLWGTTYCVKRVEQTDVVVPTKGLK